MKPMVAACCYLFLPTYWSFTVNRDKKKPILVGVTTLLVVMAVIYLLQVHLRSSKPIRVGFIGTISGKYGVLGSTGRDGALLAVEEINASGGIRGRILELVILDDEGTAEKAAAHAESLAADGIRFIIGPFLTVSGTAVLPIINKHRILTISGTTMGQNLADQDDYYIVLIPTTRYYGHEIATVAVSRGHLRLASISDSRNDPYCVTFLDGVKSVMDAEPSASLDEVTFKTSNDVLYSRIVESLDLDDIDAVFLCSSSLDTALMAQNIKKRRKEVALYSTSWGISRELVQNGGSAVEGLVFLQSIDSVTLPESYLKFQDSFRYRFKREPTYVAIFNYEAVSILARCLEEKGGISPEKARELILSKEEHKGVQANFRLDGEGDTLRPLFLHTVENGSFVTKESP